jgi:hypothetical protein
VDKPLSGKGAFPQLPDEIVLNVLLPYIRVGADKHAHKRVRIARRRPGISHLSERLDTGAWGELYLPLHHAREERVHMIQRAAAASHRECCCNTVVRVHRGELDGLSHFSEYSKGN